MTKPIHRQASDHPRLTKQPLARPRSSLPRSHPLRPGHRKQEVRHRVVGHEDLDPTRSRKSTGHNPQPLAARHVESTSPRGVDKSSDAVSLPPTIRRGRVFVRVTGHLHAAGFANRRKQLRTLKIVDVVQIDPAVTVDVRHQAAGRPTRFRKRQPVGQILERAVAVIAVQPVATDVGHVQVGPAIVVDVADTHALAELPIPQIGRISHVDIPATTKIPEQPVTVLGRLSLNLANHRPTTALAEVEIRPTVSVVIQHRHTTTGVLEHQRPLGRRIATVEVREVDSRSQGSVLKTDRRPGIRSRVRSRDRGLDGREVQKRIVRQIDTSRRRRLVARLARNSSLTPQSTPDP